MENVIEIRHNLKQVESTTTRIEEHVVNMQKGENKLCTFISQNLKVQLELYLMLSFLNVETQLRDLYKWLSPVDVQTSHQAMRTSHQPGTGAWLINSEAFREWTVHGGQKIWLQGKGLSNFAIIILDC